MASKKLGNLVRHLLPNNRFARAVSVLAGGTVAAQAIIVAVSPLLTRLYSPEDFGVLAVFASLLAILGVVASLRYQLAIPLPESDEEAANVTVLSLLVVLGMAMLTALIAIPLRIPLAVALNTPLLADYIWLLPLGLLLTGFYQVFNSWAIRVRAFAAIARTNLMQSLSMVAVQVAGYTLGPIALLLGRIVGQAAGVTQLARLTGGDARQAFQGIRAPSLWYNAKTYKGFPLVSSWTGLASSGGMHLPPLLIASFLGAGPAGIYALTHRVLSVPMTVIGKAVGDIFYREAAQAFREQRLEQLVSTTYARLTEVALPIAVVIFMASPVAFGFLFGEEWSDAGLIARWLTPWLFFQFIATPPTRVYPIMGKHGSALIFQCSFLISSVFSVLVGSYLMNSLIITIALLSVINSIIYTARLIFTCRLVGAGVIFPFRVILGSLPMALLAGVPLILITVVSVATSDVLPQLWLLAFLASTVISLIPLSRHYIASKAIRV